MYNNQEDQNTSVMDDVNDLDEGFAYYFPVLDDQEASAVPGEERPKRGRPPKDPSAAMSEAQKADRYAQLVMCYERYKASKETP